MPRPASVVNEVGRIRTQIWREKRHKLGRPEVSIVDRAVAASFAAFFTRDLSVDVRQGDYHAILLGAQRLLIEQGFDKLASNNELMRRLARRSDLNKISAIAGADPVDG